MAAKRRPMQVPGHKMRYAGDAQGWAADLVGDTVRDDVALQGGVDDNAFTNKYLDQAEALWASAVGADHSRFLVGGSSQGNIAALGTVADQDVPIAIDRTSHRSTQAALVISGARPVWIYPRLHPEFHLPIGMEASSITGVTEDVNGFFATSPSYVGTISDVGALATAARARVQPLIIDQAWGAHLDFLPGSGAMSLGADISVTSVHKALLGYSQTAVVSMHDGLVVRTTLDRWVDLTTTTSPSGTLFATIDGTRGAMERDGRARLDLLMEAVEQVRRRLSRVTGLVVLDEANAGCRVDPLKLTLLLPGTGADGASLGQALWGLGHGPEIADRDTLVLTATVADEPEWVVEFADVLCALIEEHRGAPRPLSPLAVWRVEPEVVVTPRQAFFSDRRRIRLSDAVGEVSAEQFCPYPPGVPLLAPGERVTQESVDAIIAAGRVGRVAYSSDPTLETIEVIERL
jgi:lysine decarboxylase